MKAKIVALLLGVAVGLVVIVGVGTAQADRPSPVGAHRHYMEDEDGSRTYVGPNFCEIEAAAQGFAAFHHKVHVKDPGLVDVKSEPCD